MLPGLSSDSLRTQWLNRHHSRGLHQSQFIFIQLGQPGLTGRGAQSRKGWRVVRSLGDITESLQEDLLQRMSRGHQPTPTFQLKSPARPPFFCPGIKLQTVRVESHTKRRWKKKKGDGGGDDKCPPLSALVGNYSSYLYI